LNNRLVPNGVFVVNHVVGERSAFIDELSPGERVGEVHKTDSGKTQSILEEPVVFFVHPNRDDYKKVEMEIWFQNETLPIVELGALSSANPDIYTMTSLHNRLIDENGWKKIYGDDGLMLIERESDYDDIDEFFASPPSVNRTAVYRADTPAKYRIPDYAPALGERRIDVSLRGRHEIKTYIKNEPLAFSFSYTDVNREDGADGIRATVFDESGNPVVEARAQDDGNTTSNNEMSVEKILRLRAEGLEEGVYKIVVNATQDVIFRHVSSTQQKIIFTGQVYIGDEIGYAQEERGAEFWAGGGRVKLQTTRAQGVQEVLTGDKSVRIEEPFRWYAFDLENFGAQKVSVQSGDVKIISDSPIAFAQDQYFYPDPVSLVAHRTIENLDVDYVLANYVSPKKVGDWLIAGVEFDVDDLYEDKGAWKFSFSTPQIKEFDTKLDIHKIVLRFKK
jgi:hypothetical protein